MLYNYIHDLRSRIVTTDIGVNFPKCLPNTTEELHVLNSHSFGELTSQDLEELRMLRRLHFYDTNLTLIDESALRGLENLEVKNREVKA